MILFSKSWHRYFVVLTITLLAVLAFSAFIAYRLAKSEAGICISENRVISNAEHRQAFIRNLIQLGVVNSGIQEKIFRGEAVRVGIISETTELSFLELITEFHGNDKSFEENFNINVIAPLGGGFDANKISEPFFIVTFRPSFGGGATFIYSREIVKAEAPAFIKNKHKPTLYERFRGFGNNYYSLTFTLISVECCDNRTHHRTREEYMNRKMNAYLASIESINRGFATHTKIAAASNCGELLTVDGESNIGTQSIEWIKL